MNKRLVLKVAFWMICTVCAVVALGAIPVQTRAVYTCVLCRAERIDRSVVGYSWQRFSETEFSQWCRVHRPPHDHQWDLFPCVESRSVFGNHVSYACNHGHYPICDIPPEMLRQFAERSDSATLAAFFEGIASDNDMRQADAVRIAWEANLGF